MNVESVKDIVGISLITLLKISMPVLVTILLVGVIISLVQALTQIQEPTL
ncbi:MAG: flagellar biosynthetic protein FliQ, partial [Proteobacteria bacterium]|nr:flagellar biosynthetic protein FliQ [Pseudomonadota bacterium]